MADWVLGGWMPPQGIRQGIISGVKVEANVPKDVKPCPNCGRNFNPDSMVQSGP